MQSENIGDLAEALAKAQAEIKLPGRNRDVTVKGVNRKTGKEFKYDFSYTTLDAVIDTVRGPLTKHGLWFVQELDHDEKGWLVNTALIHSSGQWIRASTPVPVDEEGIQKLGSAVTYIRRYALTAILGITSEEDDDGNAADGNEVHDPKAANDNTPKTPAPNKIAPPGPPPVVQPPHAIQIQADAAQPNVAFGQAFLAAIAGAQTDEEIMQWERANADAIVKMGKSAPAMQTRLRERIAEHYARVRAAKAAQASSGLKAA